MACPEPSKPSRSLLIQVDLDGLWAIKKVYGLSTSASDLEEDFLFEKGLERLLDLFARKEIPATFFAIGRDCEVPAKAALLRRAVAEGHEIANHTYSHSIGLGGQPPDRIREEIARAGEAIERAVGVRPVGFRAPGFDLTPAVLQAVAREGLLYDSSLLPTSVRGPLRAAARFFRKGKAAGPSGHYGSGPAWRAPREPYLADLDAPWRPSSGETALAELPVAVTPTLRLPVHGSVALAAGWAWTSAALRALSRRTSTVVYLLHAIDLVGGEDLAELPSGLLGRRVFRQPYERKRAFFEKVLDRLLENAHPRLSRDFAENELSTKYTNKHE